MSSIHRFTHKVNPYTKLYHIAHW